MFSNSVKYAMKAVLFLALHATEDKKLMVKDIYKPINVPKAYLGKLLQELGRHGIVSSTRGPKGGFYLSEKNRNKALITIVKVIDGKKRMESCMLSLEDCDENRPCPLHQLVAPSRIKFMESLQNKTIIDLSQDLRDKKAFLPL